MPGSHWMLTVTPENWEATRARGVRLIALRQRHRRKAERMLQGDRVLCYVTHTRVFTATTTVSSAYFEDRSPYWKATGQQADDFPYRVRVQTNVLLDPSEYIDAYQIAPRLLYVKRWPPEDWALAFQGDIHLLSSQDFRLIEGEMERLVERRGSVGPGPSGDEATLWQPREPIAPRQGH